jgi:hypothetical protein
VIQEVADVKKTMTFIVLASALFAAPVFAQGTPEQERACKDDAYKWCPYDVPDVDAIASCLRKNIKWISSACQAQFGYRAAK